jgi:hypothetical protein
MQLVYGESLFLSFQYVLIPGGSLLTQDQLVGILKQSIRGQFPIDDPTTVVVNDTEVSGVLASIGGREWVAYEADFTYEGDPLGLMSYGMFDGDDFYVIMFALNGGLGIDEAQLAKGVLETVTFG